MKRGGGEKRMEEYLGSKTRRGGGENRRMTVGLLFLVRRRRMREEMKMKKMKDAWVPVLCSILSVRVYGFTKVKV